MLFKSLKLVQVAMAAVFQANSQNCDKRLSVSSCQWVHSSVGMEQVGFQYKDFDKILYLTFSENLSRKRKFD